MKKYLFLIGLMSMSFAIGAVELSAQTVSLRRAEKLTEKGLIDKKNTFNPNLLDSLTQCDEYVMLISSYEGCTPCEWLRTSDVFDNYPITPYYNDFLLGGTNDLVPYIFIGGGYPTCAYFDKNGDVVAITLGGGSRLYEKLDRITKNKEAICDLEVGELSKEQTLRYYTYMYKAAVSDLRNDMDGVLEYAGKARELHPGFYNGYLLYKYYLSRNDTRTANEYKAQLSNPNRREAQAFKKFISELNAE